jgi:thioester reductase-like protein
MEYQDYLARVDKLRLQLEKKVINVVLLTGATGHLGCHVLYQLLQQTTYQIIIFVRNDFQTSKNKLFNLFEYYFNQKLDNYLERISIVCGKLEENDLGLSVDKYNILTLQVDSIIHCAADVRHYGNASDFYLANVVTTKNLLNLALQTQAKDFHYISTIGVLWGSDIPENEHYVFTEFDVCNQYFSNDSNSYTKSKYLGEQEVLKYRKLGVNANIYRLGNQAMNTIGYHFQPNIEENAFCSRVKGYLKFGFIPQELIMAEVSPVDYTALAIVKLFEAKNLPRFVFNLFNPNICNLYQLLTSIYHHKLIVVSLHEFTFYLSEYCDDKLALRCLLHHQIWLDSYSKFSRVESSGLLTNSILKELNFTWPLITDEMLHVLINY